MTVHVRKFRSNCYEYSPFGRVTSFVLAVLQFYLTVLIVVMLLLVVMLFLSVLLVWKFYTKVCIIIKVFFSSNICRVSPNHRSCSPSNTTFPCEGKDRDTTSVCGDVDIK